MIRIVNESLQDVSGYMTSSSMIDLLLEEFPGIVDSSGPLESDINRFIVKELTRRFPDDTDGLKEVDVLVYKIAGDESEIISSDHKVIQFNGVLYDYTANQFSEEYSGLITVNRLPVVQNVFTNERQLSEGSSSVKSYALLKVV